MELRAGQEGENIGRGLSIKSSHRGKGEDLPSYLRTAADPLEFVFQLVTKPTNKLYLE